LGLGPILAQSLASSASAQGTSCSASTTGEALLNESTFVASTNATSGSSDEPQNAITNAVDNANSTRFSSDEAQAVGQYYEVNMGSAQTFNEVQMQVPNSATDYARGYNINVSANGSTWTTVASCAGTGTPEIASFTTVTDQYLEVVLTAADSSYWWSINQFDIYNASSTTINSSDYYEVVNENSGLCEEPAGGATANGTAVEQEPCASPATAAQEWQFVSAGSGDYEVLNINGAAGGESWNVTGGTGATASGDLIQIWAYGDATNEQWDATSVAGGYYTFTAHNSGLCLDTPGASTASGVQLQQYTCNGTGAQEFKLVQETGSGTTTTTTAPGAPNLGPDVYVFTPGEAQATIQSDLNNVYSAQAGNQFGTQRYAMLFEPGTYGSSSDPLLVNVGYYEEIAGLGLTPTSTVIVGTVNSYNQCSGSDCTTLVDFWRSVLNLTIDVNSGATSGCYNNGDDWWGASQAAPLRQVEVNGTLNLSDTCESPGYSSGGFTADSVFNDGSVNSGTQQQYIVRNSNIDSWTGSNWNQVFCGDTGAPASNFSSGGAYTTLSSCGTTEEEPYLYMSSGNYDVFVPALAASSSGPNWTSGSPAGTSLPISDFYIASPSSTTSQINSALAAGEDLLLTPGVYEWGSTIQVPDANTKIIGLGFPTLVPTSGNITMNIADVEGINVSGVIFDAGPTNSSVLLQAGVQGSTEGYYSDPDTFDDIFFRIGGATAGEATTAFIDNMNYSLIDDMWSWRADHGNGVGWTDNVGDNGLIVNGNYVSAYGLAVEHYEQTEVEWNGQEGKVIFFQNENPYDPPSQSAWMDGGQDGYPAFQVASGVTTFDGYGMGSYCYFDQGVAIENAEAFEAPQTSGVVFSDIFTIFLSGSGGIETIINGTGGSVSSSNQRSYLTSYS
jgi:hypothetical protein